MKNKLILTVLFFFFLIFGFYGCNDTEELKVGDIEELKAEATEEETSDSNAKGLDFSEKWEAKDKFEFPDLSGMTDWERPNIIQERLDALQMPEAALKISTEGLLETCLDFPYLLDISFFDDYQKGFNAVVAKFNGFRELLKRPDLSKALLTKYYWMISDFEKMKTLSPVEQGYYAIQLFVVEFMLAQDIVFKNLNKEQEDVLFLLVFESNEIKKDKYIFSSRNDMSEYLLYAKKVIKDNAADKYANEISEFIKAPRTLLRQDIVKYLGDYIITKYK